MEKRSHTNNHKNPIGFKVTDNKLAIFEDNKPETEVNAIPPHEEGLFKMALELHKLMQKRATMLVNNKPFFEIEGEKIIPLLNKVYIRYYEKF